MLKLISPEHQRAETKPGRPREEKPKAPERLVNSDEKKIPPEAVIWVTLMSAPPPPEGAVLCGSLWPGKGGIFESIMQQLPGRLTVSKLRE